MKTMSVFNFKKISIKILLLTSFAITCCGIIGSLSFENSFAHNFSPDESALSFADYALKKFNNDIKTSIQENNTKTQNYLEQLENGLSEFNTAIENHENPMEVMNIVHTKIHPNLQTLFTLKSK